MQPLCLVRSYITIWNVGKRSSKNGRNPPIKIRWGTARASRSWRRWRTCTTAKREHSPQKSAEFGKDNGWSHGIIIYHRSSSGTIRLPCEPHMQDSIFDKMARTLFEPLFPICYHTEEFKGFLPFLNFQKIYNTYWYDA